MVQHVVFEIYFSIKGADSIHIIFRGEIYTNNMKNSSACGLILPPNFTIFKIIQK